jgi:hypothetical protein
VICNTQVLGDLHERPNIGRELYLFDDTYEQANLTAERIVLYEYQIACDRTAVGV